MDGAKLRRAGRESQSDAGSQGVPGQHGWKGRGTGASLPGVGNQRAARAVRRRPAAKRDAETKEQKSN